MRRRNDDPGLEPVTEVTVIPVIDVSLVLLVILFVSAPMMSYPNLAVDLPKVRAPEVDAPGVSVTLTKAGDLAVESEKTPWAMFPSELAAALAKDAEGLVVIRADKDVPYGDVQKVLKAARGAGAKRLAFATEPPAK